MHFKDYMIIAVSVLVIAVLFSPNIRKNVYWQALVTPLASIIGSGFLIIAPIMAEVAGDFAPWAMMYLVIFAYFVGGVIRFNILHTEPLLSNGSANRLHRYTEHVSDFAVFAAYLISVAFYLRLMSAFILQTFQANTERNALYLTTAVLIILATIGAFRGLKLLEKLEEYSVSIKLGIIGSLMAGLFYFNLENGTSIPQIETRAFDYTTLAQLAGMLIVVQGFETSRYLGEEYAAQTRSSSMRMAQIITGIIYVLFIFLIMPLLGAYDVKIADETAIIELSAHVSIALPILLVIAAAMSQFSAAVADTIGGGGLLKEETNGRIPARVGYAVISCGAIALIWSADIFEIVTIASRAFAFYYSMQTLVAIQTAWRMPSNMRRNGTLLWFTILLTLLGYITVFAIPIG